MSGFGDRHTSHCMIPLYSFVSALIAPTKDTIAYRKMLVKNFFTIHLSTLKQ